MIASRRVTVNGRIAEIGDKAHPERDEICIDFVPLSPPKEKLYIMLHKPRGYVTTLRDEKNRKTVMELVKGAGAGIYPVGRLDMDSEGLLLMTNDGAVANALTHPSFGVQKTYQLRVSPGADRLSSAAGFLRGEILVDGHAVRSREVRIMKSDENSGLLSITISEGRNRQIRKMCRQAGLRVHRLKRVSQGKISLGGLPVGKWRYLSKKEIDYLHSIL